MDLKVSKKYKVPKISDSKEMSYSTYHSYNNKKIAPRFTTPMPRLPTAIDPLEPPLKRQAHKLLRRKTTTSRKRPTQITDIMSHLIIPNHTYLSATIPQNWRLSRLISIYTQKRIRHLNNHRR